MPLADSLSDQLDRLASLEPGPFPVISLYLNAQPDQHGRDHFEPFLRKELAERIRTYAADGPERASLTNDAGQIREYLATLDASVNGVAIFASSGAGVFETIELAAPIDEHRLYISSQPHLYPLARALDQNPRYAVLMANSHFSRIFVVAANTVEATEQVAGTKTRRHKMGGWSQARYQRHIENYHSQHVKEVVDILDRVVREESINHLVISCDDTAKPLIMAELPQHLKEKIVDVVRMDIKAPEHEILNNTLEALRARDAQTDQEQVEAMLGAWRAGGLAVVGPEDTLEALQMGQVEELIIAARPTAVRRATSVPPGTTPGPVEVETSAAGANPDTERLKIADELVTKAQATSARIRFIENEELLADVGGVGALLRFKI